MKRSTLALSGLAVLLIGAAGPAFAASDPPCGAVEFRFKPGASDLQIVVWVEDAKGAFVDTPYITRLTGQFGLGNRPGTPLLKTDFRWPYGRREMVAPIWAHRHGIKYPKIVMGGVCGNSTTSMCPGGGMCAGDCEDSTIAYHSRVSSYEPFYCSPSGASRVDAMSCASKGTFAKGAYLEFPKFFSLYPPRADLNAYDKNVDSSDLLDFPKQNKLVTVSQATPPANKVISPALVWFPANMPMGDYVAWIELSQESDFNAQHNHPNQPDTVQAWDFEGHPFLGQPSVVYKVPFSYGPQGATHITTQYAGYSTWDGTDGVLHPPDGTITTNQPGSGAGRLIDVNDGVDVYRMKVVVGACAVQPQPDGGTPMPDGGVITDGGVGPDMASWMPTCDTPNPVTDFKLTPHATSIDVAFKGPEAGQKPYSYAVRYREGTSAITDEEFDRANAAPSVEAGAGMLSTTINGLIAKTSYAVAVRGNAPCQGKFSKVVSQVVVTDEQKFTTLSGCFIATAAYGSEMERHVEALRTFRDKRLLTNPLGRLFVTGYYAFGPYVAGVIAKDEGLRGMAREALAPLVSAVAR